MDAPKKIKSVKALSDFRLLIKFDDGDRVVDMKTFELRGIFKNLIKDKALFDTVHIDKDHGVVTWQGGLMLENDDLYEHGDLASNIQVATLKKVLTWLTK